MLFTVDACLVTNYKIVVDSKDKETSIDYAKDHLLGRPVPNDEFTLVSVDSIETAVDIFECEEN